MNGHLQHWPTYLVSAALVITALGLMIWHARAKSGLDEAVTNAREHVFRRWQIRRRMQISGLMCVLGIAVAIGQAALTAGAGLDVLLFVWGGVLLLVLWMLMLAMGDMMATHYHFARIRGDYDVERVRLQAEVRRASEEDRAIAGDRARTIHRNGNSNGKTPHDNGHDVAGNE